MPSKGSYSAVAQDEESASRHIPDAPQQRRGLRWGLLTIALLISAAVASVTYLTVGLPEAARAQERCLQPALRREWRSLSTSEQSEYIRSVQCLHELPSELGLGGRLSDDFSWLHFNVGSYAHERAAFLSWHRWFLHLYEQKLQTSCGYNGNLVYWDWTLDWQDLTASPIWDPTLGFGGDGDPDLSPTDIPANGTCIKSGPFSDYEVRYTGWAIRPHCLSRGFGRFSPSQDFSGEDVSPAALRKVLDHNDFWNFVIALENGPHNVVPYGVGGDFGLLTAPNDPSFFLHHTQLDRVWWLWQQTDPATRLKAYHGSKARPASPGDVLPYEPLAPNITVRDILDTEAGMLCYRY